MEDGERTFRASFTAEGLSRLLDCVREKLQEVMGTLFDNTLAEYIVVLLRNGRCKDEAAKELQVFLGNENVTFVSWLWDHLSSNLHLYVQSTAVTSLDEAKTDPNSARGLPIENRTSQENLTGSGKSNHEPESQTETNKISTIRPRREWGGIVGEESEAVPLRSVVADSSQAGGRTSKQSHTAKRSHSPGMHHNRKRSREDDAQAQPSKRISSSHPVIAAPRRLLQFAVRDAVRAAQQTTSSLEVRAVQQTTSSLEPSSKRLRSVLSTLASDSALHERIQRRVSDARMAGATAALRAAAEAAEDVTKDRSSASVFNRLGSRRHAMEAGNESFDFREEDRERMEYEDLDHFPATNQGYCHEINQDDENFSDANMFDLQTEGAADFALVDDRYETEGAADFPLVDNRYDDSGEARQHSLVSSQSPYPCKDEDSYSTAQGAAARRNGKLMDQDSLASSVPRTSGKIVNISVNVNTWKTPNYEPPRSYSNGEAQVGAKRKAADSRNSNATISHVNDTSMTDKPKGLLHSGFQVESQKVSPAATVSGSFPAGQPQGVVDSRTIFVSNVHFAATKDSLSRHFNKFGAVLKVVIVTDGATGKPTGSAYIEFLHKESAEQALSLNGTSFMLRILKVVRKGSHEVPQLPGRPRASRGSAFASRLIRTAYPRPVTPGAVRGRLPLRLGARSFQWKRGAAGSPEAAKLPVPPGNKLFSPTARSFTYTRTQQKANGSATT